jgi:riboflavin transporter
LDKKTYKIVLSGILVALSIVLTRLLSINIDQYIRISFGFVPIILAGIVLGPYFGFAVGGLADFLGCLLFGVAPYPLITLTSALVGLISWLIYRLMRKTREWIRILLAVAVIQVVCTILLQTLWLSLLYGQAYMILLPWRAIIGIVSIPIYAMLIYAILAGLKKANLIRE